MNIVDNFIKINNPSGKLEFFKYSIVIVILQTIATLFFIFLTSDVFGLKSIFWLPFVFFVFFELPLLYLYFIQCAKRLWDITGNKKAGILTNLILFTISFIGMISFPLITVIIYLILILYQGKIVKDV
jgi:hypothetical protein